MERLLTRVEKRREGTIAQAVACDRSLGPEVLIPSRSHEARNIEQRRVQGTLKNLRCKHGTSWVASGRTGSE